MNKQKTKNSHYYNLGSFLDTASKFGMGNLTQNQQEILGNALSSASAILPNISKGNTSIAGNIMDKVGGVAMGINPIIGAAIKGAGALTNAAFGSNVNLGNVQAAQDLIQSRQQDLAEASTYDQLASTLGNNININNIDLGTQGWFSNAVDTKRAALQNNLYNADLQAALTARNINNAQGRQMMMTAFADGGKIYIKPENRGKFTAAAKARGMGVQEFANKVLANKEDYSPLMIKRANFSKNAANWNAFGGPIDNTFTNGVTIIGNGGTHEDNPNDGVQIGTAPDGKPNLVEEEEVIYNNFVYSNRLNVPKAIRKKYKLRGETFAEAFKQAQKESEERPNDPISKNGLDDIAMVLATSQEELKNSTENNKFACGGKKYDIGGDLDEIQDEIIRGIELQNNLDAITESVKPQLIGNPYRNLGWLRYAEPAANVAAVTNDITGLTNKPYKYDFISPYTPIQAQTLGDYVQPELFDRNYWTNQALANQAATRRALTNMATPATAANILAADYNAGLQLGQLARQGQEFNRDQTLRTAEFNRATNQANAQAIMQAAEQNARNQLAYDQAALQQAKMNIDETNTSWGARATNLGALATSIANIGRERDAYNQLNALIDSGVFGTVNDTMKSLSRKRRGLTY